MIFDPDDPSNLDAAADRVYRILKGDTDDRATYAALRDRRLLPVLTALVGLKGPSDLQVAETASYLLGEVAGPEDREAVQALLGALDHENDRVKLAAATALGQIGAQEAEGKVLAFARRMMEQGQIGAVSRLAQALARIGGEEARAGLAQLIDRSRSNEDKHVQHVVAEVESAIRSIDERLA